MNIKSIIIENVRNFTKAEFDLENENTVFVGPNNTGKTSVLILLNWIFNELSTDYLRKNTAIPSSWESVLLPARETRNSARRITLLVEIDDGRKRRKYPYESGESYVRLRFNIRLAPPKVVLRLNRAKKSEPFDSEKNAIDLLADLQSEFSFNYISPFRGHSEADIGKMFEKVYKQELKSWHDQLAPNSKESKDLKSLIDKLNTHSDRILSPRINDIMNALPADMRPQPSFNTNIQVQDILSFLASTASLNVSTGSHDKSYVSPSKVGSGLRSLLELAVKSESSYGNKKIIAVEEPEAFLHPLAQRMLAKRIYSLPAHKRLISTHSPIIVEESELTDVVLVKDQQFYPFQAADDKRLEINSAFLKKHGAELLFAQSILLVEGESDFFFFEILKERLMKVDAEGILNGLYVLPIGGNSRFAPYVKLIDGFGKDEHPISWLIVSDGDACSNLRKTLKKLKRPIAQKLEQQFQNVSKSSKDVSKWIASTKKLNRALEDEGHRIILMPGDLEYTVLENSTDSLLDSLRKEMNIQERKTKEEILQILGSKGSNSGGSGDPKKAPHLRAHIARQISGGEFSDTLKSILYAWSHPIGASPKQMNQLIGKI